MKQIKFGIARRLTLYFTICLLLFVLIIGTAFSLLLYRNSKQTYVNKLRNAVSGISDMIASTVERRGSMTIGDKGSAAPKDSDETGEPFRPDGDMKVSVQAFSNFISGLTNATVWLIAPDETGESYDMLFMMQKAGYVDTDFEHLSPQHRRFIEALFETGGGSGSESGSQEQSGSRSREQAQTTDAFSQLFSESTITVGAPVVRRDGTVMGAVIIHASAEGVFEAMKGALITMGVSMVAALVIGLVLALILARNFTKPLLKINDTALMISEGNYSARTDVRRPDEIGILAETVDDMSRKLEAASEESRKLQQLRQDFIGNISHELRTPVTVMRGSLEALCDGVVTEPELVAQYHTEMLKESKYMQRLVNDLLDLSRLQNPDFSMNITEFNLFDCISDAVRSARKVADTRGLPVDLEYDTAEYPFKGDYDRIRQMLLIVLDNAVKFTDNIDDPVKVSLRAGVVEVTNVGRGITAEELPYVFERFYRSRAETNKNGTGLGLSIARQIALRHGVGISVRSVPGAETTFIFDFVGCGAP